MAAGVGGARQSMLMGGILWMQAAGGGDHQTTLMRAGIVGRAGAAAGGSAGAAGPGNAEDGRGLPLGRDTDGRSGGVTGVTSTPRRARGRANLCPASCSSGPGQRSSGARLSQLALSGVGSSSSILTARTSRALQGLRWPAHQRQRRMWVSGACHAAITVHNTVGQS